MGNESIGKKAVKGSIWAALDKFGTLGIQFVVNLILARILLPVDFGAIGMIAIFIAVSTTLIEGGFGSALIQKKEPSQTDYSTIFFWNLAISTSLYVILFVCSPLIADFFDMPVLNGVLRVLGVTLILTAISTIQTNRLQKQLQFTTIAATNILSFTIAGAGAVIMAFWGFGVWSLVALQLLQGFLRVTILLILTRWLPSLTFSYSSLSQLFGFGGYLLIANILQEICKNVQGIIIGKRFSAAQMGYFSQAYKLDNITSYSIPQIIVQVMFPVYSSIQDDNIRLVELLAMNVRVIAYLVFPILGALILIADPIILFLYGEKWLPAAPYFQILCVGGMFISLQNVNFYAVAAKGRSRILFLVSFYKWGMLLVLLLVGMMFGMKGLMWSMVVSNLNIYLVNAFLVSRYVGLRLVRQLKILFPIILLSIGCLSLVMIIRESLDLHWVTTLILFVVSYLGISASIRMSAVEDMRSLISRITSREPKP